MRSEVDWENLSRGLGFVTDTKGGWTENGGTLVAQTALRKILGDELFVSAVNHYAGGRPGGETARSILRFLKPPTAIERCHEIYLTSKNEGERNLAVNLLKAIGDVRVVEWLPQYLSDPNTTIQIWGVEIVQEFIYDDVIEFEKVSALLRTLLDHPNIVVREKASQLLADCAEDHDNI